MRVIAEVIRMKVPVDASSGPPPEEITKIADEAAHAPGSEQLLTLVDTTSGDGLVIHLWNDQEAYDAWTERRKELTAQAEAAGGNIEPAKIYEVTYRS